MTKPMNKIKKLWEDKTGVSPIIAVILMVAITVVLAATIYVWVSGFGGGGGQSISMSIGQDGVEEGGNATFMVNSVSSGAKWGDIEYKTSTTQTEYITVNATNCNAGAGTDDTLINAGDTFTIAVTDGETLTIRDPVQNSVVLTKTVV